LLGDLEALVGGKIQQCGGIMVDGAPGPLWARARCEMLAVHKALRREGVAEIGEV